MKNNTPLYVEFDKKKLKRDILISIVLVMIGTIAFFVFLLSRLP